MKSFVLSILDALQLTDADPILRDAIERVFAEDPALIERAVEVYYAEDFVAEPVYALIMPTAEKLGISKQAMNFIIVAAASQRMQNTYRERGYDESLWTDFLKDVRCKTEECFRWEHVHGLGKITYWHPLFFKLQLFALGRLQYQIYQRPDQEDYVTVGGYTIAPDEPVFFIHIPALGPLTKDLRMDSYRRAYEFFKNDHDGRPFVLYCTSWLLYEEHRKFLPPTSNILDFMNDFKIVKSFPVPEQQYLRVFDIRYEGDASILPRDTSLRRGLAEFLEAGGEPGGGDGYFLFDENGINKE